jgi:nucleoside-diphosphate-sugar epimerase
MTLSIAVLGATGVYGRHLVPRLVARGHRVRALVRRPETAAIAAACGAELHRSDVFDGASLRAGLEGCDIGINLATSLPGPSGKGDYATNDRLRREGTPVWVRACHDVGVSRIVLLGYLADRVERPGPSSTAVEQILGRPARSFAEWAAEHSAVFGQAAHRPGSEA